LAKIQDLFVLNGLLGAGGNNRVLRMASPLFSIGYWGRFDKKHISLERLDSQESYSSVGISVGPFPAVVHLAHIVAGMVNGYWRDIW
jgi:hypothetical protein